MLNDISVVIPCIDFVEQVGESTRADTRERQSGDAIRVSMVCRRGRKTSTKSRSRVLPRTAERKQKGEEIAVKKQRTMNVVINKFMDAAVAVAIIAASSHISPKRSRPCSRRRRLRKTSFQKEKADINIQTQNKIAADNKDLRATLDVNQIEIVSK